MLYGRRVHLPVHLQSSVNFQTWIFLKFISGDISEISQEIFI